MSVITAITAQNTLGVTRIQDVGLDVVEAQIDAVLLDIGVDIVKIGMLASPEIVRTVAKHYVSMESSGLFLIRF